MIDVYVRFGGGIMEVGVDCVDIARFSKTALNKKLSHRIFTDKEIEYCRYRKPSSQHYAARFAGKEAVVKALSPYGVQISLNRIEILNDKDGIPCVRLLDHEVREKFSVKISLSHSKNIAIAAAIVSNKK